MAKPAAGGNFLRIFVVIIGVLMIFSVRIMISRAFRSLPTLRNYRKRVEIPKKSKIPSDAKKPPYDCYRRYFLGRPPRPRGGMG